MITGPPLPEPKPSKKPREPRTPARTVVYVEKLFGRFPLAQRKAMYAMLASVCEPATVDEFVPQGEA